MTMKETAQEFFDACETGKGWEVCSQFCTPDASFASQAEAMAGVETLEAYTEWMKGIFTPIPDGSYELRSFGADEERRNVCAYAVFSGTNTAEGGPVPATGKSTVLDYVYIMQFEGDRIAHMTKVWNSGATMKELGWA